MSDLPTPRNPTDRLLAAIHDRLGELLDRFPAAPEPAGNHVELREPAVVREPAGGGKVLSPPDEGADGSAVKARRPTRTPAKPRTVKAEEPAPAEKPPPAKSSPRRRTPAKPKTTPKPEDT